MSKKAINTVNTPSNKKEQESVEYRYTYALSYISIVKGHYNKDLKNILNDKLSKYIGRAISTSYDTKHNESHIRVSIDSVVKLDQSILTVIHDTVKIYEDVISTDMFILPYKVPIYG